MLPALPKNKVLSEIAMNASEYITARKSQLKYYRDIALFSKIEGKGFVLYKKAGMTLSDMRLDYGSHPDVLYISQADKLRGLREAQKGFNAELENYIKSDNPAKVRETVVNVVEETLTEPRSGGLEGISETVDILVGDYVKEGDVIKNLIDMTHTDYSIVLHSINVMAFALGFASYMRYSQDQTKELGLCALLHDVGKTKINQDLLAAPRKLTDEEFEQIKSHTTIGFRILAECKFVSRNIALTALEHHEKMDGSGYPQGKKKICEPARIVGLIDCYEALTTDERPYREAMAPFGTLDAVIGTEVNAGKYDRDLYVEFVKSLGSMAIPADLGMGADGREGAFQVGA